MIGAFSIVKQEVLMTQEKVSPLREQMIPSNACRHALPGNGRHAHPRDG